MTSGDNALNVRLHTRMFHLSTFYAFFYLNYIYASMELELPNGYCVLLRDFNPPYLSLALALALALSLALSLLSFSCRTRVMT